LLDTVFGDAAGRHGREIWLESPAALLRAVLARSDHARTRPLQAKFPNCQLGLRTRRMSAAE